MRLSIPYRETWLHRVNPALKLLATVLLLIVVLFIHRPDVMFYLTAALLLLLFTATGHPAKRLLLYASPFVLLFLSSMSTMTLFGKGATLWFQAGPVHVTEEGFIRGLHIGLRTLTFSSAGLLFALTTRPVLLFYSLMQQLRVPPKYAYSFMAGVRLVPLMAEELQTLRQALQVRGMERRGAAGLWLKLKRYSVPMLAQSIRRAQRIAVAMEAKRFSSGSRRTYFYELRPGWYDLLWLAVLIVFFVLSFWAGQHIPIFGINDVRELGS